MSRLLSQIKSRLVSSDTRPRTIRFGEFRGITMWLNLQTQSQLYVGLFEHEVQGWLGKLALNIQSAVDIGTGQGEYTLYFLHKTRAARVIAAEPDPVPRTQLCANLDLNPNLDRSRLLLIPEYIGVQGRGVEQALDSLLPLMPEPCLIKLDVDTWEEEVLKGAAETLQRKHTAWIVETHSLQLERACIESFERAGYRVTLVPQTWWRAVLPEMRVAEINRWLVAVKPNGLEG